MKNPFRPGSKKHTFKRRADLVARAGLDKPKPGPNIGRMMDANRDPKTLPRRAEPMPIDEFFKERLKRRNFFATMVRIHEAQIKAGSNGDLIIRGKSTKKKSKRWSDACSIAGAEWANLLESRSNKVIQRAGRGFDPSAVVIKSSLSACELTGTCDLVMREFAGEDTGEYPQPLGPDDPVMATGTTAALDDEDSHISRMILERMNDPSRERKTYGQMVAEDRAKRVKAVKRSLEGLVLEALADGRDVAPIREALDEISENYKLIVEGRRPQAGWIFDPEAEQWEESPLTRELKDRLIAIAKPPLEELLPTGPDDQRYIDLINVATPIMVHDLQEKLGLEIRAYDADSGPWLAIGTNPSISNQEILDGWADQLQWGIRQLIFDEFDPDKAIGTARLMLSYPDQKLPDGFTPSVALIDDAMALALARLAGSQGYMPRDLERAAVQLAETMKANALRLRSQAEGVVPTSPSRPRGEYGAPTVERTEDEVLAMMGFPTRSYSAEPNRKAPSIRQVARKSVGLDPGPYITKPYGSDSQVKTTPYPFSNYFAERSGNSAGADPKVFVARDGSRFGTAEARNHYNGIFGEHQKLVPIARRST